MTEKIVVGINPYSQLHYIDHLGIVCILMDAPLIVTDEKEEFIARSWYPGLKVERKDFQVFNPDYLITHFDVIISSDMWNRHAMKLKYTDLEKLYGKELRWVHCPHGFSDKGFYLKKAADEDILLVYGEHMLDMLRREGVYHRLHKYVIGGNYRLTYYLQHKTFMDAIVEKEVLSRFETKKPILLYAPTWMDLEHSSSYFEWAEKLFDSLPEDFNMIVKLHPRLEFDDTARYYQLLGKYERKKNVLFLKDFPLIFALLNRCDIYLGDQSAIGYDFLFFNRPMFFLNPQRKEFYLSRCGVQLFAEDIEKLYARIEEYVPKDAKLFAQARKEAYAYTFGKERPFNAIKADIVSSYS